MNFYREAAIGLRQNVRSVALYAAIGIGLGAIFGAVDLYLLVLTRTDASAGALSIANIASRIGLTAAEALANTVIFSRIGREMDKPMWRVADDRDALRLFYRLWLLLGLLILAFVQLTPFFVPVGADEQSLVLFLTIASVWSTLLTIFGAFVMFYGRAGREEVKMTFSTLGHQVLPTIAIVLVGLLAGCLFNIVSIKVFPVVLGSQGGGGQIGRFAAIIFVATNAIIFAASSIVSCFIFAYAWLVCIFHRDHHEERSDDFDF